ncbi:DUF5071 domain-containing protein [Paenibacillus terrigena]|uniref:DUF5071 domain-containing protein n=1 Tax=Paenibacillus terrigena TaxID=369333 RepID=UPI0003A2915E|nr:DUF5071 domain-containing protein [Paenibacillus terrigena]
MQLIEKLSWDAPDEEKSNAKIQLKEINDKDLHFLVQPLTKGHWDGAAEVIVSLGYPRVQRILPGLLEWIQDLNWPGAMVIADFLKTIGSPLIPFIRDVLQQHSDDDVWIGWIFSQIINEWSTEHITQLKEELILISQRRDNDIEASRLLLNHKLLSKQEILSKLEEKKNNTELELHELIEQYPNVDCEKLNREFRDLIFKPNLSKDFYERNLEQFSFCNKTSYLREYLNDIDSFVEEVSYFA